MKIISLLRCAVLYAAITSTNVMVVPPTLVLPDTHGISGFELYGNGLFWWAGPGICAGKTVSSPALSG